MNVFNDSIEDFYLGLFLGVLIGEGHFGGDGKQPHITVKMHVRHKNLLNGFVEFVPGSKLYGPYLHQGRNYYLWVVRGRALERLIVDVLDSLPWRQIDEHSYNRYRTMKRKYKVGQTIIKRALKFKNC